MKSIVGGALRSLTSYLRDVFFFHQFGALDSMHQDRSFIPHDQ